MREKLCLEDISFEGKTALVRVDFNVPIMDGKVDDDTRIKAALPTIKYLLEHGAKVVLLSHLGRVKSLKDKPNQTLKPVAELLQQFLPDTKVNFSPSCVGESVKEAVSELKAGDILLLENTRYCDVADDGTFISHESSCDEKLAEFWASLGDVFVNDAFGTIHRQHASNYGIAKAIKISCIGFLIQKELQGLQKLLTNPESPYTVIMGGAKAADKIGLISNFLKTADKILLAGGIATSFLYAEGHDVGKSIVDGTSLGVIEELISSDNDHKFVLPVDFIAARELRDEPGREINVGKSMKGLIALDIGPETCKLFAKEIHRSKTIFWNGPPGVFEMENFRNGTKAVAKAIAEVTRNGGYTVVGGGDSASAVNKLGMEDQFSFISTGGGASLTLLEGTSLPSLEIITNK